MDKERILSKIDELDSYLLELKEIVPNTFDDYVDFKEKRRACERLLQISIETVIDICNLILKGLRLGIPGEEEDVFDKLEKSKVITKKNEKNFKEHERIEEYTCAQIRRSGRRISLSKP